ncbi:MAG: hypothetical protein ACPG5Y_02620, partial [Pseudomonadales bacterium]
MATSSYYVPESSRLPIFTSVGLICIAAGAAGMINHISSGSEGDLTSLKMSVGLFQEAGGIQNALSCSARYAGGNMFGLN